MYRGGYTASDIANPGFTIARSMLVVRLHSRRSRNKNAATSLESCVYAMISTQKPQSHSNILPKVNILFFTLLMGIYLFQKCIKEIA